MKSYKVLLQFAEKLIKKNRLNQADAKAVDLALKEFKKLSSSDIDKLLKDVKAPLKHALKAIYSSYVNGGYKKFINLKPYTLNDIKPKLRKELDNAILNSLGYIKSQSEEWVSKLDSRFRTWTTVPNEELRGKTDAQALKNFKDYVDESKLREPLEQFIIEDQTRKLLGNLNRIASEEAGAIGFIWRTRQDKRVVGNPIGLYPKGYPIHMNHYEREGQFCLIRNNWAIRKGLVKKTDGVIYADDINDGLPSVAIGCRCWAEYVLDVEDVPDEILTKKGREYIDE